MSLKQDGRTRKLAGFLRGVLSGTRRIQNRENAKLFLEATSSLGSPTIYVESLFANQAGLEAVRTALRADTSSEFIQKYSVEFLRYISHPDLKLLANGELLGQLLVVIVEPPVFWQALHTAVCRPGASSSFLEPFAWLSMELLSLPVDSAVNMNMVVRDIETVMGKNLLLCDSAPVVARQLGYRIANVLEQRSAAVNSSSLSTVAGVKSSPTSHAGGRHDNDFADFRRISLYPTPDEILSTERPFYRAAAEVFEVAMPARTGIHLDNQFRLLRESMLAELREGVHVATGVKKARRKPMALGQLQLQGLSTSGGLAGAKIEPPVPAVNTVPSSQSANRLAPANTMKYTRVNCSLVIECGSGLEALRQTKNARKYLKDHPTYLRARSLGVLVQGATVAGFAFVERDEDLLSLEPPKVCLQFTDRRSLERALAAFMAFVPLQFVVIDSAFFTFEPVLKRLQEITELPLERQIMDATFEDDAFQPESQIQQLLYSTLTVPDSGSSSDEWVYTIRLFSEKGKNKTIELDSSQRDSLYAALSKSRSLIQGPPGTGKSFIGSLFTKIMHDRTDQTILIMTYTNHALDQCLSDLIDLGIPQTSMVRLGFKATPRTRNLLLSEQRRVHGRKKLEWDLIRSLEEELVDAAETLGDKLHAYESWRLTHSGLLEYLEFSEEYNDYFEAFTIPFDRNNGSDGFKTVGRNRKEIQENYLVYRWMMGKDAGIFKNYPSKQMVPIRTIWMMKIEERRTMLATWKKDMLSEHIRDLGAAAETHDRLKSRMDALMDDSNKEVLKQRRIIACTTVAAAKYADTIRAAKPDVIVVEEAGEILESHVLTALGPSVRQLVLIGDHKQLRPKVDNYELSVEGGRGFDLNRSLFERLILQGHPHTTLHKQHRMCPEISVFSREDTYPELVDAPSTHGREEGRATPRGLQDRVIFMNHGHPEDNNKSNGKKKGGPALEDLLDPESVNSRRNTYEARMVLQCVRYLSQQGYGTSSMVVLTPYLGQVKLLLELLSTESKLDPVLNDLDSFELVRAGLANPAAAAVSTSDQKLRVSSIDNYQGEESDIVIVSLTRCNENGDIGFMAAPERVNVMRTRARNCLIMLGNAATFLASRKGAATWRPFLTSIVEKGHMYDGFPVRCEQHPGTTALLVTPEAFREKCPDGGCSLACDKPLPCGQHTCKLRCHRIKDHSKVNCTEMVSNLCSRGHITRARCGELLQLKSLCGYLVDRTCSRGHKERIRCDQFDKPDSLCKECKREDDEMERRAKRDLELEKERQARQERYRLERQEIEDEIAHQKRIVKYAQEDSAQKKELEDRRKNLEAVKAQARNLVQQSCIQKQKQAQATIPAGPNGGHADGKQDKAAGGMPALESASLDEWEQLKKDTGVQSKALDELMSMIGLEDVKEEVLNIKSKIDLAVEQGLPLDKERFGCVLLGNPGTGKTTVARLLTDFLTSTGAIPGSCLKEVTGAALANGGVSGCEKMVQDVLDAGGGVIFIDEAYQLSSGNSAGGGAVLDYLLPEVENLRGKIVFILAGYSREMETFFSHNPGLPSRFPLELKFADYTDDELLRILALKFNQKYKGTGFRVEGGLDGLYCRIVSRRMGRGRGKSGFGNARAVEIALTKVEKRQAARIRRTRRTKSANKQAGGDAAAVTDSRLFTAEDLIGPEPASALAQSEAWGKLQKMVGLAAVKRAVQALADSIQQNYQRELTEQPLLEFSLNKLFLGSPGTGKTTVAKLYGRILVDMGLLSKGEVIVKTPADFVGSVLGQSEKQTKGILAAAEGKVLVIDEAYGLYAGGSHSDPFKTAIIDTIVAEVQYVPGDDRCVLLLGYRDQMETMLQNVNPGLSRRFPLAAAFEFDDFTDSEMQTILDRKLKDQGFVVTDQARRVAMEKLGRARNRANFGNAGEIDILLDTAKINQQLRLTKETQNARAVGKEDKAKETTKACRLEAVDFDKDFDRADRRGATNIKALFAGTFGQEAVVKRLEEFQQTVQSLRAMDLDPRENIPFNFLFCGPPGTGKTTTAQKMGKVFYDLGFLDDAKIELCSATDLIGQYVGQTGPKVLQQLDKALGRVLFIDEAYRLNGGRSGGGFASEATDELVDALTKPRYQKKLVVILAGYTQDMDNLLAQNSGLSSRFSERVNFRPLTGQECVSLLQHLFQRRRAELEKKKRVLDISVFDPATPGWTAWEARLQMFFEQLAQQEGWGSARDVETIAKESFNEAIRASSSAQKLSQAGQACVPEIVLTEAQIEQQLEIMLRQRQQQSKNQALCHRQRRQSPLQQGIMQSPPPPPPPQSQTVQKPETEICTKTATATTMSGNSPKEPPADDPAEPDAPKAEVVPSVLDPNDLCSQRDAGVSDAIWEQLQRDRQAVEKREAEYQKLKEEAKSASQNDAQSEALRESIIKRLLEEEARRKKEAEAKAKLAAMGICPMGFAWIPQGSGWRCTAGGHFVSKETFEGMM